jgi:hypothetical protein
VLLSHISSNHLQSLKLISSETLAELPELTRLVTVCKSRWMGRKQDWTNCRPILPGIGWRSS